VIVAGDTRERMIRAGAALFRDRGYVGTGFREIVARANDPRGSIYHHFPGGKTQLAEEVVRWVGDALAARIEAITTDDPESAIGQFVELASVTLVRGPMRPGCPVAAATLGADHDDSQLVAAADAAFNSWQAAFAHSLREAGVQASRAADLATLTVAAMEGALILCRAHGNDEPLRRTAAALRHSVRAALHETP